MDENQAGVHQVNGFVGNGVGGNIMLANLDVRSRCLPGLGQVDVGGQDSTTRADALSESSDH